MKEADEYYTMKQMNRDIYIGREGERVIKREREKGREREVET